MSKERQVTHLNTAFNSIQNFINIKIINNPEGYRTTQHSKLNLQSMKKLKIIEIIVIVLSVLNFVLISLSLPNLIEYLKIYSITEFHNL